MDTAKTNKSDSHKHLKLALEITGIFVVIAVLAIVLFFREFSILVTKRVDGQKYISYTEICTPSDISRYNDALMTTDGTRDEKLTEIKNEITNRPNYENDPTCIFISFYQSLRATNKAEAARYYKKYAELSDQGIYPSSKIKNLLSVPDAKISLDSLPPDHIPEEPSDPSDPNTNGDDDPILL